MPNSCGGTAPRRTHRRLPEMEMTRAALVADLKASLLDAERSFKDEGAFSRHLDVAAAVLSRYRPLQRSGVLQLVPGQVNYPLPADCLRYGMTTWGAVLPNPWEASWPGPLPRVTARGGRLWFMPAPTAKQVAVLGAEYAYFYDALHVVGDAPEDTTVEVADRDLLLLRAQAEAMQELAIRDGVRPVTAQGAGSGQPKTGIPAALAQYFIGQFRQQVRR